MSDQAVKRRVSEEWYTCVRCDFNYPRSQVVVQLGKTVCRGPGTNNCFDEPGRDHFVRRYVLDQEEPPQPLPENNEDI